MMIQMVNTVASWHGTANRAQSLEFTKGHLVRVMNRMLQELTDAPVELRESPNALFLLAGFSWRTQVFRIWTLHYDAHLRGFTFRAALPVEVRKQQEDTGDRG